MLSRSLQIRARTRKGRLAMPKLKPLNRRCPVQQSRCDQRLRLPTCYRTSCKAGMVPRPRATSLTWLHRWSVCQPGAIAMSAASRAHKLVQSQSATAMSAASRAHKLVQSRSATAMSAASRAPTCVLSRSGGLQWIWRRTRGLSSAASKTSTTGRICSDAKAPRPAPPRPAPAPPPRLRWAMLA